ncbi:ABC transporter sugar-binding protein [Candidatus Vecturithrix granuli]|uniref:ABC transporter sugar-binding protein n=1 Tax=Vecturithrix granuli TaxID=1499967 RepID=A0A081C8A4_VECG1|nr:ABC transporter sugar-binding protein [Candidatus Vecturithrix granuli]
MRKSVILCVVCMMFAVLLSSAYAADKVVIALVPKALDNPVFTTSREAAKVKAEELGVELIWTASQKADAAEQVAVIESLIQKKVSAIGISVNDPTALKDVINKAMEAGIPVSTWDSDSPDSNRLFYLGTDNYAGGFKCGEIMKGLLPDGGKVAILTGVIGAFNLEERIRGFKEAVKDTKIEVVDILAGEDDINKSVEVVNTYTLANKDKFDAWFFDGGWPLFVPIDTLEPVKNFPGKVISFDTFPPMLLYVKEGVVDVLVGQDFATMGAGTVEMLYKIVTEKAEYPKFNDSGLEIVDASNIDETIAKKGTTW